MLENAMAARGRPAKILTSNDLMTLQQFLKISLSSRKTSSRL
jgi:hypothetical protein